MSLMMMDQEPEFLNLTNEIFTRQLENNQGAERQPGRLGQEEDVSGRPV